MFKKDAFKMIVRWLRWYNSFIVRRKTSLESSELEAICTQAQDHYNQQIKATEDQWQLSRYRWLFDPNTQILHFTHNKGKLPNLRANAQVLASHFIHTQEWHWSWSTPHIPKAATRDARKLRHFGRQWGQIFLYKGTLDLTGAKQQAPTLAALALHLYGADTVYQGQSEQQTVYFLLRNLQVDTEVNS